MKKTVIDNTTDVSRRFSFAVGHTILCISCPTLLKKRNMYLSSSLMLPGLPVQGNFLTVLAEFFERQALILLGGTDVNRIIAGATH